MAQLPIYSDFESKSDHFKIKMINNIDEFQQLMKEHATSKGIYRGISSSAYKIFTSWQRTMIKDNLEGKTDLLKYVNQVRNNDLLAKYFQNFNVPTSEISIFSLLQHYGAPSPILDFTKNLSKALYFSTEDFDETKFQEKSSIDDYCSIFFIKKEDLDLLSIPDVVKSVSNIKKYAKEGISQYPEFTDTILIQHIDQIFEQDTLKVFLVDHFPEYTDVYNAYNNIRIIAQEGLFIYNTYPTLPLEESLKEFFIEATEYVGHAVDDISEPWAVQQTEKYHEIIERNKGFQARLETNIIESIEINKKLIPEIKKIIQLNKKDIYPDLKEICLNIFNGSIRS